MAQENVNFRQITDINSEYEIGKWIIPQVTEKEPNVVNPCPVFYCRNLTGNNKETMIMKARDKKRTFKDADEKNEWCLNMRVLKYHSDNEKKDAAAAAAAEKRRNSAL